MPTYTPLQSIQLATSAASVTFSGIPQTYQDLVIVCSMKTTTDDSLVCRLNADAGSSYSRTQFGSNGLTTQSTRGGATTTGILCAYGYASSSNVNATSIININNYSNTTTKKTILTKNYNGATGVSAVITLWNNTSAVNSITLQNDSSYSFASGCKFDIYGIQSGSPSAFGGDTVTTDGTYWYHTFKSSGTFTLQRSLTADILAIGGGGASGSGAGGGGGAGAIVYATSQVLNQSTYTLTIGGGGTVGGSNGANTTFGSLITAAGGGNGGGENSNAPSASGSGGGGGGPASGSTTGASAGSSSSGGTVYTNAGGNGSGGGYNGGGGGGSGSNGVSAGSNYGGNGGAGLNTWSTWATVTSTGVSGYYAGGGGGCTFNGTASSGGSGGGGQGGRYQGGQNPAAGTANTGSGGGGGNPTGYNGGAGGSGIIIVRYPV